MNVLIIDDDLGIRETLGTALETQGHHVETAVSGDPLRRNCVAETLKSPFSTCAWVQTMGSIYFRIY